MESGNFYEAESSTDLKENASNAYLAIIGDIKSSRKIADRAASQRLLADLLEDINQTYSDKIASRFTITLGDEFQGLLVDFSVAMPILAKIKFGMYPYQIRAGIGIGSISTEINPDICIGADGPAFYRARSAVEHLKKIESHNRTAPGGIMVNSQNKRDGYINATLKLMYTLSSSWSRRQRIISSDMLLCPDSQKNIAIKHGITQPTVQKALNSGHFYAFKEGFESVDNYLSEVRNLGV